MKKIILLTISSIILCAVVLVFFNLKYCKTRRDIEVEPGPNAIDVYPILPQVISCKL